MKQLASVLGAMLRVALMPVVFLVPAGTWRWPEAWALTGLYVAYAVIAWVLLSRWDPELLAERTKASPVQEDQVGWDKALSIGMFAFGIAMLVVPGLDVVRYGWTEPLPVEVEVCGWLTQALAFVAVGTVMRANTFLSRVVKVDTDRGHHVITDGPYALVRHPMYAAMLPMLPAMPLSLGSRWGLVPALGMVAMIVWRTALEDRTLHEQLPGYAEYARKTRYRLIPGLW